MRKASGIKVYLNGVGQPTSATSDKLTQTTRTKVPFKIGQRHGGERIKDVALQDLRVYEKTLKGPEVEQLAKSFVPARDLSARDIFGQSVEVGVSTHGVPYAGRAGQLAMFEEHGGPAVVRRIQLDAQGRHRVVAECPVGDQQRWWLAVADHRRGVLAVAEVDEHLTANVEVARNLGEPARQPLGLSTRGPDLVDGSL